MSFNHQTINSLLPLGSISPPEHIGALQFNLWDLLLFLGVILSELQHLHLHFIIIKTRLPGEVDLSLQVELLSTHSMAILGRQDLTIGKLIL